MPSSPRNFPIIAVGAVIRNDAGEVLLVRRGSPPRLHEWSIPGGKVKWGEPIRAALVREVREETGLEIWILGLIDVVDSFVRDGSGALHYHHVLLDYAALTRRGELQPGDDIIDAKWVRPADLDAYEIWSEMRRIIRESEQLIEQR